MSPFPRATLLRLLVFSSVRCFPVVQRHIISRYFMTSAVELTAAASPTPTFAAPAKRASEHVDTSQAKRPRNKNKARKNKNKQVEIERTGPEGYLLFDVLDLRRRLGLSCEAVKMSTDGERFMLPFPSTIEFRIVEAKIEVLSSTGDGVGVFTDGNATEVVVVPFAVPGDVVRAKLVKKAALHYIADFIDVLTPGPERDDSLIKCKYFSRCGGCQLQMLPYTAQLAHKRRIIERAYKNLCIPITSADAIPKIGETIGSPMEYAYRTKLTPHFDVPRHGHVPEELPVGFTQKGRSHVIDIEECPIATPAINKAYAEARIKIKDNKHMYKRGVTLMFREGAEEGEERKTVVVEDSNATMTEYVGDLRFQYTARDFFQCNNSVLPAVTSYVKNSLHDAAPVEIDDGIKHLVDAYCGSGLFAVTCSDAMEDVIGVEISDKSVECASRNAAANGVANADFVLGDAAVIFERIKAPSDATAMILDPSRKGCDERFLSQLLTYGPRRVVYVSCNVHTQARDVARILRDGGYVVESIRGFDFFPQTHHVESVAVLRRVDKGT
ncbi:S-adenosyl-L-methionine-dependent methyltransferase [Limtongia smithiae]|uniref:S-adenosyl-L-methionine-dependent methyltransferase n=1 Tax=Limtongia smithiae TaxID=1125753 RepID=UPI0034CF64F0